MFDLHTSVIDPDSGELDSELMEAYADAILQEFADSPEALAYVQETGNGLHWMRMFFHYSETYFAATPATIEPEEFCELLFELIPRKVSTDAESAYEIIGEFRAFWQYLKRTRSLENTEQILLMLTDEDAEELYRLMDDPENFGTAKSMVMAGKKAGFNMQNKAEMAAFFLAYNQNLLAQRRIDPRSLPNPAPLSPRPERSASLQNAANRVGRNELCPCGSGRKYKKCCLR